jgi:hypothetical protein
VDTTPQNEVHAMAGLLPGDYFIYALEIDGQRIFSYGLLRSIDGEIFRADFRCVKPRSQPLTIPKESHQFVGRISEEAYELARLRGWPNSQTAVSDLIDFSAGKKIPLSFSERFSLPFAR